MDNPSFDKATVSSESATNNLPSSEEPQPITHEPDLISVPTVTNNVVVV